MIILLHPRTGKPKNRRFPLAVLSIAAVLEGREEYAIVDGNLDPNPSATIDRLASSQRIELLAVSVMPGPQMVSAIELCRAFRKKNPRVPIVWGGYFPSLYTDAALNAGYVDYCVRGQGEETLPELLEMLRGVARRSRAFERERPVFYGCIRVACPQRNATAALPKRFPLAEPETQPP